MDTRTSNRSKTRVVALLVPAMLLLPTGDASAWIFPEHAVITETGYRVLPDWARHVIANAMNEAREGGLGVCLETDEGLTPFFDTLVCFRDQSRAEETCDYQPTDCVHYGALPALAADHSVSAQILWDEVLTAHEGEENLVGDVINEISLELWYDSLDDSGLSERLREAGYFGDALARQLNQYYGLFDRADFIRGMDVELFSLDPNYIETAEEAHRTHFQLAGTPLHEIFSDLFYGDLDNALAQFIAHHVQSLRHAKLFAEGGDRSALIASLMHHAFALHFLEDSFAAGHMVVPDSPFYENEEIRKQRHDYFNRRGLLVTRALALRRCDTNDYHSHAADDLANCWTTFGDGYLGTDNSWDDLTHAAEAVMRAQLQYATALDTSWLTEAVARCDAAGDDASLAFEGDAREPAEVTFGRWDPSPTWTMPQHVGSSSFEDRACVVFAGALMSVNALSTEVIRPIANSGSPSVMESLPEGLAEDLQASLPRIFHVCHEDTRGEPNDPYADEVVDPASILMCPEGQVSTLGTAYVSLLRPLIIAWPVSQLDVRTIPGRSPFRRGFGYQLTTGPTATGRLNTDEGSSLGSSTVGGLFSYGFAFITDSILPGQSVRPAVELNFGFTAAAAIDAGDLQTQLFIEGRWQILWDLMMARFGWRLDWLNLAQGMRFYWVNVDEGLNYLGWDIEAYSFHFEGSDPERSATDPLPPPTSFRIRLGRQTAGADPLYPSGGFTFATEFVFGLRNFF